MPSLPTPTMPVGTASPASIADCFDRTRCLARLGSALLGVALVAIAGCASVPTGTSIRARDGALVPVRLLKPDGDGPFPAIVLLHDCSGLGPRSSGAPARWAAEFTARGYVVAIPDSFTARGFGGGVCTMPNPERAAVAPARRVQDARATLDYLASLSFVDRTRVGLMGGSHGGTTVLAAMAAPAGGKHAGGHAQSFAAAVALYPGCAAAARRSDDAESTAYRPLAPLLILIGDKDDWTPAEPCRRLADRAQRDGHPVAIKVYPGVHHAFDSGNPIRYVASRVNGNSPTGRGATTGGDPEAWADSIDRVASFFALTLGPEGRAADAVAHESALLPTTASGGETPSPK
jgi:dienelactone hydrolase